MAIDPSTAQGYANVFGGGLVGAVIATLVFANVWQFIFAWRERAQARSALAAATAAHIETAKSVANVARDLAIVMERTGRRRQEPLKAGAAP